MEGEVNALREALQNTAASHLAAEEALARGSQRRHAAAAALQVRESAAQGGGFTAQRGAPCRCVNPQLARGATRDDCVTPALARGATRDDCVTPAARSWGDA
eukprot:810050-Prorocentrum_minimum.AAC.2